MFYQVLWSLGAQGGPWDAEMQGIFPPMWESRPRGTYLHTKGSVLEGFLADKTHRMHGEHVSDVISSTEVAGGKWWLVGWNGNVLQCGRNPQDRKDLHLTESELGLSLANGVLIIHGQYVLDVLSSTGVAGGKECYLGC